MRHRLAVLAALVGGITLVGAAGAAAPAPTAASDGGAPRPGDATAVPRARVRRQRPRVACARRTQRRRARERLAGRGRPRRPARGQRASLRRRPRARREREHDRRACGCSARCRPYVPHASKRERGDRHRRLQRGDLGAEQPDRDGDALRRKLETQPPLAYGTRIHDAITRSLVLLRERKALVRLDRAALRRCRHRQRPDAGAGGRRGEGAAGADLHRRPPLGRVRPGPAALDRRAHRWVIRRSPVGRGARGDLRGAWAPSSRASISFATARPRARCRRSRSGSRSRGQGGRRRPTSRRRPRCWLRTTARRCRRSCSRAARRS